MPTYKYKREDGSTFEVLQNINDEPLEKCPDTGQKVKRVISGGGGVLFKGSGFYGTDYKNGNDNSDSTNSKPAESQASTESNSDDGTD